MDTIDVYVLYLPYVNLYPHNIQAIDKKKQSVVIRVINRNHHPPFRTLGNIGARKSKGASLSWLL